MSILAFLLLSMVLPSLWLLAALRLGCLVLAIAFLAYGQPGDALLAVAGAALCWLGMVLRRAWLRPAALA